VCGEVLAGLSPHWVTSPLKALGRICAVTLGGWESADGWKALKPRGAVCKEDARLLLGLEK